MINSFNAYLREGKVKRQRPDPEVAKSLFGKGEQRLSYAKSKKIDEANASFVLEDAYEAMREAAQALMSLRGFKPYSHEATISFLKEFHGASFNEEEMFRFDTFRQLRHDSMYKAASVSVEDAKASLLLAGILIAKIRNLLSL